MLEIAENNTAQMNTGKMTMKKGFLMAAIVMGATLFAADPAPKVGEFVWNELATTDVTAAKEFYGSLFGWEFVDKTTDEMTYVMVKKEGQEFAGIWAIPKEQQEQIPPHWIPYILVENVENTVAKVEQNGGKILKPTQKVADMGLFAIIQDPTGAHLAVWQNLKK